jgi:hypothetical protein
MVIDYERAELLLSRRLPDDPHEWTLPMRFQGVPTVRATVGGRPIALVVDSGANATVFARGPPSIPRIASCVVSSRCTWSTRATGAIRAPS